MVKNENTKAVQALASMPSRSLNVEQTTNGPRAVYPHEMFGMHVFDNNKLRVTLPSTQYKEVLRVQQGKTQMTRVQADYIAHAVRIWAMELGATHFTHWFQPQTGLTAEKHDSFLSIDYVSSGTALEGRAIDTFSGSQLMQQEPDASSFPHGGMRTTFEARGYTVWDTSSPMFVRAGPHERMILYIPTVFISYNGEVLDEKTILLRSTDAISQSVVRFMHLMGSTTVKHVHVTLGIEQEFFLVNRDLYAMRADLKLTGRTLMGRCPPKHQQLEDHYFGSIPSRALAAMSEAELDLWKLGMPLKTRHNEVAPQQFEMAPVFEDVNVAIDHNQLLMSTLHRVAHLHGLRALFHEKPFQGVNGSGKHCNWSLLTDTGVNLLEPTEHPEKNIPFILLILAILDAVQTHAGLLRASIASSSNDARLGANEAPPAVISVFLGTQISAVLDAIETGRPFVPQTHTDIKTIKLSGTAVDLMVSTLPEVVRDQTDRNRTSPMAFTGNKFEFRAVGSRQSPSFPMTVLNSAVASSLSKLIAAIEAKRGARPIPSAEDLVDVARTFIINTKSVRFEGDGYSERWLAEARQRGLPALASTPEALGELLTPKTMAMLVTELGIMTEQELASRHAVLVEKYIKDNIIEARTFLMMVQQQVIPAVFGYRRALSSTITKLSLIPEAGTSASEMLVLRKIELPFRKLIVCVDQIEHSLEALEKQPHAEAMKNAKTLLGDITAARQYVDDLEKNMPNTSWPMPKYYDMLL